MGNINYNWILIIVALVFATINVSSAQEISFDNLNANTGSDKTINWSLPGVTGSPGFGHRFVYASTSTNRAYLKLQFRHNSSNWTDFMKFTTDGNLEVYGNSYFSKRIGIGKSTNMDYPAGIVGSNPFHQDVFSYEGAKLNHYGFGFHDYDDGGGTKGTNAYISGFFGIDLFTGGKSVLRVNWNGNIGIGVNKPAFNLQIGDGVKQETKSLILAVHNNLAEAGIIGFQEGTANKYMRFSYNSKNNILKLTSDYGDIIHFSRANKTVGIGTTLEDNPNGYLLGVNGTIGAKEVVVENTSRAWPDYVFEKDYKKKDLFELELFLETEKHLPDVPSAKEIAEKGINLGEMNAILLKKIEELTLYLIEQNHKIELLQKGQELMK